MQYVVLCVGGDSDYVSGIRQRILWCSSLEDAEKTAKEQSEKNWDTIDIVQVVREVYEYGTYHSPEVQNEKGDLSHL